MPAWAHKPREEAPMVVLEKKQAVACSVPWQGVGGGPNRRGLGIARSRASSLGERSMADGALVLVTGLSGFVGKHCGVALLNKGYRVRSTVRSLRRADAVRATLAKHAVVDGRLEFVEADLGSDVGWDAAAQGCQYVMHVASPFPIKQPKDRDALLGPARDGTLRVLKAASKAGATRTVVTSSIAAIMYGHDNLTGALTEEQWTNLDGADVSPYVRSKTLAERAAWDFMKDDRSGMNLSVINPGFILGPTLDGEFGSSIEVIQMMLRGKYPAVPHVQFPTVDVRDVADMQVLALNHPAAANQRFLCTDKSFWFVELIRAIRAALPEAKKMPTKELPSFVVRALSLFNSQLRAIVPELDRERVTSHAKAEKLLGFRFRSASEAAVASAKSLIQLKLV
ncbi:MAG: aldehyde reductase [Alphaproteobacteria bacterium]|nr:aldehyde reductase [Alphaproteobacteria bacterium]